jgi:hypothetical protein
MQPDWCTVHAQVPHHFSVWCSIDLKHQLLQALVLEHQLQLRRLRQVLQLLQLQGMLGYQVFFRCCGLMHWLCRQSVQCHHGGIPELCMSLQCNAPAAGVNWLCMRHSMAALPILRLAWWPWRCCLSQLNTD